MTPAIINRISNTTSATTRALEESQRPYYAAILFKFFCFGRRYPSAPVRIPRGQFLICKNAVKVIDRQNGVVVKLNVYFVSFILSDARGAPEPSSINCVLVYFLCPIVHFSYKPIPVLLQKEPRV